MRWTTAWLLALAVHGAVVAAVWLGCRSTAPSRALPDAVELAVLEVQPQPEPEPVLGQPPVSANAPKHKIPHAHAHEHGHAHAHEDEHAPIPERERADGSHQQSDAPGPAHAPINLNLAPNSLAALTPEAPSNSAGTLDTATLHGSVSADGTMHIRDKSSLTLGSDLTQPGKALDSWLKDPKAHAASRDGTVAIVQGTFDVTDSIMRAHGQDPYRAQRMKMLDETREQRLTLAARDRSARRETELAALPTELRNIWKDEVRSAKERREIIFQLWDECQEPAEGEVEGAAAGARARREIVLFIRERLAEGSREAYPKEELATLNLARQSRQRFDPYGRSPL